jgi:hypothetical protein
MFFNHIHSSVEALKKSIKVLRNPRDFGAISPAFVPYPSIIPVFTAIRAHVESAGYKNILDVISKIKKWYWSSIFTLNYSSSVESTSAKDFSDLKKWFENDEDEPENYIKFIKELENQDFKKQTQKGSAIYNAIFDILILNEARDWYTSELPEYENLDDHHIIPQSWGKKNVGNDINSILNKTPLSAATNRYIISDRMPFDYLKEMKENNGEAKFYKILESHLISKQACEILMRNPFKKEDYYAFIAEREKTVKLYIQSNIIEDRLDLPPQLKELDLKIEEVELKIRDYLSAIINDNRYDELIPPHISEKVLRRIQATLKKKPSLTINDFQSSRKKMDYFDLQEYFEIIASKVGWELFEEKFRNKGLLQEKFSKLGELRNSIRHSRDVNEVAVLEGKAAIIWFSELLNG